MKKAKKFTFYVNGDETAWVVVWPSQVDRFECIIKRVCLYASKFGYNLQYETTEWDGNI